MEAWDVIVGDIGDEARAHENVQLVAESRNSAILNAMKTAAELESGFGLYFKELAECEKQNCWWALLHVLVALPDICAAMDGRPQGGQRYIDWCLENFTANPIMSPGDRYQMRCSLLHEGTTLTAMDKKTGSQYTVFSFIDPRATDYEVHQLVEPDTTRGGQKCTVNVRSLADDTRAAMRRWFGLVAADPKRNAIVEANLKKLAMIKPREMKIPATPGGIPITIRTTSESSS